MTPASEVWSRAWDEAKRLAEAIFPKHPFVGRFVLCLVLLSISPVFSVPVAVGALLGLYVQRHSSSFQLLVLVLESFKLSLAFWSTFGFSFCLYMERNFDRCFEFILYL